MLRKCFVLLAFLPLYAAAQNGPVQGFCTQGGISATVSGLGSSNKLQGIIPGCTITVYLDRHNEPCHAPHFYRRIALQSLHGQPEQFDESRWMDLLRGNRAGL